MCATSRRPEGWFSGRTGGHTGLLSRHASAPAQACTGTRCLLTASHVAAPRSRPIARPGAREKITANASSRVRRSHRAVTHDRARMNSPLRPCKLHSLRGTVMTRTCGVADWMLHARRRHPAHDNPGRSAVDEVDFYWRCIRREGLPWN
jgi:hypothetical protein